MKTTLFIIFYLIGAITYFISYYGAMKRKGDIHLSDLIGIIFLSLFSWIAWIGFFISMLINKTY